MSSVKKPEPPRSLDPFESATCNDCGSQPASRRAMLSGKVMCRPCAEKRGHMWIFKKEIDMDKLTDVFGDEGIADGLLTKVEWE